MVPHLVTALSGPLLELEKKMLDSMPAIERWFRLEWQEHAPPFYGSVDLRNSGCKLAPVDTNLFPASFHHLSPESLPLAVQAAMGAIEKHYPDARNVLIVADERLDDLAYLQNLARLTQILRQAGLAVQIGSADPALVEARSFELVDGAILVVYPLVRMSHGRRIGVADFDPCMIILNNDMSKQMPEILRHVPEQELLPQPFAGWWFRRKSQHFGAYDDISKKFAKVIDVDPWLLNAFHLHLQDFDPAEAAQRDMLSGHATALLSRIRKKYRHYGVREKPFVVVKSDRGTRGAGVASVRDPAQLLEPAFWQAAGMDGAVDLLVQEGVPTIERISDTVAEPVVCMIDRYVVGSFYRVQECLDNRANLNTPSAHYVPLAFAQPAGVQAGSHVAAPNRFYMYGVVARLAQLAAAVELERTDPDAPIL